MVEQIEGDGAADAPASVEPVVLEVRVILPTEAGTVVQTTVHNTEVLDPVRSMLQEMRESCHLTNYSLEMRDKDGAGVILSEFVEVGMYLPQQDPAVEQGTLELRVVQNDYDLRRAKEHVKRFRDIVMFPQHLSSSSSSANEDAVAAAAENSSSEKDKGEQEQEQEEEEKKASEIPDEVPLPKAEDLVAPLDLSKFYFETLTRLARVDPTLAPPPIGTAGALAAAITVAAAQPSSARLPSDSIKAISYSGWSPPPSHRRAAGDLLYLDVFTVDSGILQITASPAGFFVNASSRSNFDPAPAAKPCFAPTLLECLQMASPAFRLAWAGLSEAPKEEQQRPRAHPLDSIVTSLAQGRPEVLGKQWCAVPPSLLSSSSTSLNKAHRFDAYRAQSCSAPMDLEDDDLLRGLQREWSEDVHSCLGAPETFMKARFLNKTYADFAQTALAGAEAVVDGLIQPFNPNERPEMQVFVFNGVYFSSPLENRELRLYTSPDAARKIAGHDLKNMRHLQTLFSDSFSTVLHAVVDYKGRRLVAQTSVPGVLSPQGGAPSSSARLMYGCLASGERISCKKETLALLNTLSTKLFLPQRSVPATLTLPPHLLPPKLDSLPLASMLGVTEEEETSQAVRVDSEDEAAEPGSATVPFVGPFEGKVVKGSDGRTYLLEMTRITPRDANYVAERGTGLISPDSLAALEDDVATAYVLRHELVLHWVTFQLQQRKEATVTAFQEAVRAAAATKLADLPPLAPLGDDASDEAKAERAAETQRRIELLDEAQDAAATERQAALVESLSAIHPSALQIELNPNVFLPLVCDTDPAVVAKDEETARLLARFLHDRVLPELTASVRSGDVSPVDNASLTVVLHQHGVNMRYLGRLAKRARAEEQMDRRTQDEGSVPIKSFPLYWRGMVEVEIVARTVKHIINDLLAGSASARAAPAATIAGVLSAVLSSASKEGDKAEGGDKGAAALENDVAAAGPGSDADKKKKKHKKKAGPTSGAGAMPPAVNVAPDRSHIVQLLDKGMRRRFLYSLEDLRTRVDAFTPAAADADAASKATDKEAEAKEAEGKEAEGKEAEKAVEAVVEKEEVVGPIGSRLSRLALLRRLCQLLGLQVATRAYDFTQLAAVLPGDITGLTSLIKTTEPFVVLPSAAQELQEAENALGSLDVSAAYNCVQRALSACESVFLSTHQEYIAALEMLARVMDVAGRSAEAAQHALKALLMQVQLTGLDSFRVVESHKLAASMLADAGAHGLALQHLLAARFIVVATAGDAHPELMNIFELMFSILDRMPKEPVPASDSAVAPASGAEGRASLEVTQLKIMTLQLAKMRSCNMHHSALLSKLLGDVLFEAGDVEHALNEHRIAKMLYSAITGEESGATLDATEALRKTMAVVIGEKVRVAKAMQEEAVKVKVKGEVPRPQPQPQTKNKKTGSYKSLFQNHSRLNSR